MRRATMDNLALTPDDAVETAQDIESFWRLQYGRDPPAEYAGTWIHLVVSPHGLRWHHESYCQLPKRST